MFSDGGGEIGLGPPSGLENEPFWGLEHLQFGGVQVFVCVLLVVVRSPVDTPSLNK